MLGHDRLFKELIETFFEEFMVLFFPEVSEMIDYSHLTFLSEEVFSDVTVGEKKVVDLLAETKLKGEDSLILIHVEPQSYFQKEFNERMYIYFSRLYEKHRKRILPIAIFSYEQLKDEPDTFILGFPVLEVMSFRFMKVELKKQKWREYIRQDNPVAAALLSKMGYTKEERVEVKKEFLRMLIRLELDPARMQLITGFFESYLHLTNEEEQILRQRIKTMKPKEEVEIMELLTSWEKKGREEGKFEVAKNMLQKGLDVKLIIEVTGLSEEDLVKVIRKFK